MSSWKYRQIFNLVSKTALALFLFATCHINVSHAATAFVQSIGFSEFDTVATVPVTFSSNTTAGNLIAGYVSWASNTINLNSVTGCGNTYSLVNNPTSVPNTYRAAGFYAENITGGACTVTANFSGGVANRTIIVHEVSGAATASSLDGNALLGQTDPGLGANAVTSGSIITTANGDYIFGATSDLGGGWQTTAGTGFTGRELPATIYASEDKIQASAGSIAATFNAGSAFADHGTLIMAFKPAAAAARRMRLFEGYRIKLLNGKIIQYPN